jgi:hypothetical protein
MRKIGAHDADDRMEDGVCAPTAGSQSAVFWVMSEKDGRNRGKLPAHKNW